MEKLASVFNLDGIDLGVITFSILVMYSLVSCVQ